MPTIEPVSPHDAALARLLHEADARAASLYPAESRHGSSAAELERLGARLFIARLDGALVGCGGHAPQPEGWTEVKRLFVRATSRGQGVGRALMQRIETDAAGLGIGLLRLETGVKSGEALGLYRSLGYHERPAYGWYAPDPLSVFMEKSLSMERSLA